MGERGGSLTTRDGFAHVPTGGDLDRFVRHRRIAPPRGPRGRADRTAAAGQTTRLAGRGRGRGSGAYGLRACGARARCRRAGPGPGQIQACLSGGRPLGHPAPADRARRGRRLPSRDRHPRGAARAERRGASRVGRERALRVSRVASVPARPSSGGRSAPGRRRIARHAGPDRSRRRADHAADRAAKRCRHPGRADPGHCRTHGGALPRGLALHDRLLARLPRGGRDRRAGGRGGQGIRG